MAKVGRPTKYTPELADRICELVATHDIGLPRIAAMYEDLPAVSNIKVWRIKYPEFQAKYAQAKAKQIEFITEEILEIADDGKNDWMEFEDKVNHCKGWRVNGEHIQRSRLRIDARKWLASKLAPKIYGDTILQDNTAAINQDAIKRKQELDEKNRKDY
jgi:hypothetical protein